MCFVRYFYLIIYDGKLFAISRIADNDYDCHYEIIEGDIVRSLNEKEFDSLDDEAVENRWGGAELTLTDDDPSTVEIETDFELNLDNLKLKELP